MSALDQPASVRSLLITLLFSDAGVLKKAWNTPFLRNQQWQDWRHSIYIAYQPWAARYPDHVFDSAWRLLEKSTEKVGVGCVQAGLVSLVDEFVECTHGNLHIKRKNFGAWQQSLISRMSSLSVQATAQTLFADRLSYAFLNGPDSKGYSHRSAPWADRCLPLLKPYDPIVEDYISREGLHETHLHLNGTTHAEICWLRALVAPNLETKRFDAAWNNGKQKHRVRELVSLIDTDLGPAKINRQLRVAKVLRGWLVYAAVRDEPTLSKLPHDCAEIDSLLDDVAAPFSNTEFELSDQTTVKDELEWQKRLMQRLAEKPSVRLERMFHCYILLQNIYYRLLVQSEGANGFDQFQKFTLTELRESAEKEYLHRFQVMHGMVRHQSRSVFLEGRFAPKSTVEEMEGLLCSILDGYRQYLANATRDTQSKRLNGGLEWILGELQRLVATVPLHSRAIHRLALVVHFIKLPWNPDSRHPYRHYDTDKKLRSGTAALLATLKTWPRLGLWLRGVDGAANELHAPPECFAASFRICKQAGLTRRSFHAGEDFAHLLSGIRAMLDALELLDLTHGDRIGHGTAMGISPLLWLERMPRHITISRGEWLLSVLAAWRLMRETHGVFQTVELLRLELEQTASEIFGRATSPNELEQAMAFRDLSVFEIDRFQTEGPINLVNPLAYGRFTDEALRVADAAKNKPAALALLWAWQSDQDLWERSEELVEKKADFLNASDYVLIQQALMQKVKERGVVVETLPSSNVRISIYTGFHEHHSLRWMRVPGHVVKGDPEIMVSLGSDDPGIFAADLESDFHQLLVAMTNSGLSEADALSCLAQVNERGRIHRFHDRSLP